MHWLTQAFAVADGYLANRKMVHCFVPVLIKMMTKTLIIVHCLVPVLLATMRIKVLVPVWNKITGAGMDILALLLGLLRVTFIIQLLLSVTMIATMVLIIITRIRTIILGRVKVTATVIEIVVVDSSSCNSDHDSCTNSTSK